MIWKMMMYSKDTSTITTFHPFLRERQEESVEQEEEKSDTDASQRKLWKK
jgi:hypothetical protein